MRKDATCCTQAHDLDSFHDCILYLMTVHPATSNSESDRSLPLYSETKAAPTAVLFLRFCNQIRIWKGSFFGHKPTHTANLSTQSPPSRPCTERKVLLKSSERQCANIFACIPIYSKLPVPGTAYRVPWKGHCHSSRRSSHTESPRTQPHVAERCFYPLSRQVQTVISFCRRNPSELARSSFAKY